MNISFAKLAPALITAYFAALITGLYLVDWSQFSVLSWAITFYVALFAADFISGLVHLYIDYHPLNYAKGYDQLFFYKGDRGSEDFRRKKQEIGRASSILDMEVYHFKVHHRNAAPYLTKPYHHFFYETCVPATGFLIAAIVLSTALDRQPEAAYLSFALLVISVGVLHTNHVHAWVHGSKTMPWGVAVIKVVQRLRLMYSVETHNRHHKDGESGFCFIVGHSNFLVDYLCRVLLRLGVIQKGHWHGER